MNKILAVILLLAIAVPAGAGDWQSWIEQRTEDLRHEQESARLKNCERLELKLAARLSALKADWETTGPSPVSRKTAVAAQDAAAEAAHDDCGGTGPYRTYLKLQSLIKLLDQ